MSNFKINESESILPLILYYDDFEIGNPLGSHAGIHKLGAVYTMFPSLPPMYQGSLDNIFLVLLFHSSDFKEFGAERVFSKFLEELQALEDTGILLSLNGKNNDKNHCI